MGPFKQITNFRYPITRVFALIGWLFWVYTGVLDGLSGAFSYAAIGVLIIPFMLVGGWIGQLLGIDRNEVWIRTTLNDTVFIFALLCLMGVGEYFFGSIGSLAVVAIVVVMAFIQATE